MDVTPEGSGSGSAAGVWIRRRSVQPHLSLVKTHTNVRERILRIRAAELDGLMAFVDCDQVIDDLITILRGWNINEEYGESPKNARIRLKRTRHGYRRVSQWVKTPAECREAFRTDNTDALFGVHYDLLSWYVETQRSCPCLHSAAVGFGSGLVVFPNTTKAGKTTLTVQLAMHGHQVFGDDWLPVQQPASLGVALGILPWLRLPAPAHVRNDFKRFLESRRGPSNRRWTYVNLRPEELAPQGAIAPVRGLVLLDRKVRGRARLAPVSKDRMLTELIEQNYARQLPASGIFDQLYALTEAADCFSLRYASVTDAALVLQNVFGRPGQALYT